MLARRNKLYGFGSSWDHFLSEIFDSDFGKRTEDPVQVSYEYDDNSYYVRAVVPGFNEKELYVNVNDNILTVSGKKEKVSDKDGLHSSSRSSFTQSVRLGNDTIPEDINAEHKDGILVISIPRKRRNKIEDKTIPIKVLKEAKT